MNIHQRINAIRKAINYIQKDKSVSTGKGSYKAVTHDAVTGMVRQHMIEQGVVCIPNLVSSEMLVATPATADRGAQYRYEAVYEFTFANIDEPKDCITIKVQSHAIDNADKAPGKAISYAKKYAVLKLFEIETGEDEESRYQQDQFDLYIHLQSISASRNMDELKARYGEAYSAAGDAKDKAAQRQIIAAKDARKVELQTEEVGQL